MKEKPVKRYSVILHAERVKEIARVPAKGDKVKLMTEFIRRSGISGYRVLKDGSAANEDGNVIRFEVVV